MTTRHRDMSTVQSLDRAHEAGLVVHQPITIGRRHTQDLRNDVKPGSECVFSSPCCSVRVL